jgi:hypothetical protein
MRPTDQVAAFVGEALSAGRDRAEIAAALTAAGWTPSEVETGLGAWAEAAFVPPVPRPRPHLSARDTYRYGLMFVALAVTAWHLAWLSFVLIDRWLPDPTDLSWEQYRLWELRWSIAALAVFAPLFLVLNLRSARATRADPGLRRSAVRKWLGYLTLFLAAISILSDLLVAVYTWLNGELSPRFALKAATVAAVAGLIFLYFRAETRGDDDAA